MVLRRRANYARRRAGWWACRNQRSRTTRRVSQDEARSLAYFSSPERNAIATDIYRIRLDGTGMTRLSQSGGTNRAIFNPDFSQYVGVWSNVTTPTQVRLHRSDGSEVRVIDANAAIIEHVNFRNIG